MIMHQKFWNVFVMKTNFMHYLSLIYFVNQPLHVSDIFAHHQEVFTVYVQQLVRVIHVDDWQLAGSGLSRCTVSKTKFVSTQQAKQTH
jgi:hypothetical protein